MSPRRCFLSLAIGLLLACATMAACSAIDPNPPDPHLFPAPDPFVGNLFDGEPADASDAEAAQ